MQKNYPKILFLILLPVLIFSCTTVDKSGQTGITTVVILHTNDTHGHPLQFDFESEPAAGGIPARATLVNNIRKEYSNVLVLDAGDMNTGRPESNFFSAEPDIIGFNYTGYDAMVLGNHEFDKSIGTLMKQVETAEFEIISATIIKTGGSYLTTPWIIKEYDGIKIGVFGLTTRETTVISNPDTIKGLVFLDEVETASRIVAELEPKTDIIIALTHLGIYEDENTGSKGIAKNVQGIDLIIDGHTHTRLEKPVYVQNIPIVQAWKWGLEMGKAVLRIKNKQIVNFSWEAVPVNSKTEQDPVILADLERYAEKVDAIFGEEIGEAGDTFSHKNSRTKETALGDLVADSMLWYTRQQEPDFALQNGGGIRQDLPRGKITKKTIFGILPFDNTVVVLSLKGTEIISLFNHIATIKQGDGGFPQVSEGVRFTLNYATGKSEDILIKGKKIDPDKTYKVATNSYLSTGGNGYTMFTHALERSNTYRIQWEVMSDYIIHLDKTILPGKKNRITIK